MAISKAVLARHYGGRKRQRLRNTTPIPDAVIRQVLAHCKPAVLCGVDVMVRRCGPRAGTCGRAYIHGSTYHDRPGWFIVLRPYVAGRWPRMMTVLGRRYWFASPVEWLVLLAGHEYRHIWQRLHPRGWRVWGARGRYSQRDADAYGIKCLRAWRRERGIVMGGAHGQ